MKPGHAAVVSIIGLTACFAMATMAVRQRHDEHARHTFVGRAVAESIGMCTLALSCDGTPARNPMEGPACCLGDIPGGYCLHGACDLVTCPGPAGRPFTLELVSATR